MYLCGMRIREVIKEKGLKASELASKIGMTESGLNQHINGNPSVKTLEKIANALEVPITELFAKQTEPTMKCPHCGKEIHITIQ